MLIFEEIPSTIIDELKTDVVFGKLLSGISAGTFNPEEKIPVYIFFELPKALCFDMEHNRWFKIDLCATENVDINNILYTDSNPPVVYIECNRTDECKVIAFNLETGVEKEYKVDYKVETECNDDAIILERFQFCSNMCAGYDTKLVKPNIPVANRDIFNAMHLIGDGCIINTVFIRHDERNDDIIKMIPKFSLKGTGISLLARNPLSEVAIVLENNEQILIYDDINCSMTKLEVETSCIDKIFPTERSFVIHNDIRCICITRLSGPELSQPYEIKTISLNPNLVAMTNFFCSNIWFRLIYMDNNSGIQFQCVKHDTLLAATTPDDIEWNDLPLPMESSDYFLLTLVSKTHLVGLPRRMLRCHPKCPHCDAKQRDSSTYLHQ